MSETLLNEIAEFLEVDDLSQEDALASLVEVQRQNHPDRFQERAAQRSATERFKKAGGYIDELRKAQEESESSASPRTAIELVKKPGAELSRARLEIAALLKQTAESSEEVRLANSKIENLTRENRRLAAELTTKRSANIVNVKRELVVPYRPTKKTLAVTGLSAAIGALGIWLGQLEALTTKVLKPLGIAAHSAGVALFVVFGLSILLGCYRYLRAAYLERRVAGLCTTGALRRFAVSMQKDNDSSNAFEFVESDVLQFVRDDFRSGAWVERLIVVFGLVPFDESTIDCAKDLLLAHMFNSGLVEAGPPHNLERVFRTKKRPGYISWDEYTAPTLVEQIAMPEGAS